jgi:hypothetical protein
MSKWSSDSSQRRSKRYRLLHARLKTEIEDARTPEKIARHRREREVYRQTGEVHVSSQH